MGKHVGFFLDLGSLECGFRLLHFILEKYLYCLLHFPCHLHAIPLKRHMPGGDLGKKSGVRGMKCPQNWGSMVCGAEVIQKKVWHSYFLLNILPSVFFEMQVPEMKLSTMWWDSWYFHPLGHMVWFFQVQFVSAPGFPILYEEDWHWNDTDLNSRESAKLIEKLIPRFQKKITFPTLFVVLESVSTSVNITYQKRKNVT